DLPGDALAERDHAGLAGAVDAFAELAHATRVRSHADDRAGLARDHAVEHRAGAVDHAPEIDLHFPLPLLADLLDEERVAGPSDVVDEHVDATESSLDRADHRLHTVPAGHVRADSDRLRSERRRLARGLATLCLIDLRDHDVRSLARERQRDRP